MNTMGFIEKMRKTKLLGKTGLEMFPAFKRWAERVVFFFKKKKRLWAVLAVIVC